MSEDKLSVQSMGFAVEISKLQISLKECYETEYWLELMQRSEIITDISNLMHDCEVIRRILISSINTAKKNQN